MGSKPLSEQPFRSGYVSIVGRPNVGKSTFLNAVLGEKVSIVTSRPQTTRNRIIGIKTLPDAQIVFIDTPGIHSPQNSFGEYMVREAHAAVNEVDIILFMVEPYPAGQGEKAILRLLERAGKPVILLINKIDEIKKQELLPVIQEYSSLFPFVNIIPVSALKGDGVDIALGESVSRLPEGPKYYPDDIYTDQLERFMVAEIIREKIMLLTHEEVPHAVAVDITSWLEREKGAVYISANIYVEREGQKGIIIGKRGGRLKTIGSSARKDVERLLNTSVYLDLHVKVKKDWRADTAVLTELGYK